MGTDEKELGGKKSGCLKPQPEVLAQMAKKRVRRVGTFPLKGWGDSLGRQKKRPSVKGD